MANPDDDYTREILKNPEYVGCWVLEAGNYMPLKAKPSAQVISNTLSMLGWEWIDYERP